MLEQLEIHHKSSAFIGARDSIAKKLEIRARRPGDQGASADSRRGGVAGSNRDNVM